MGRLALLAILLLALVPTAGRIAQAQASGHQAVSSWAELCTVQGLRKVLLPAPLQTPAAPREAPHTGADCDYCPLLAAAVAPVVATVVVPPQALPPALCTSPPSIVRSGPHPCGLGSRGPPTVS